MFKAIWELRLVIPMLLVMAGLAALIIAYPWLLLIPVALVILGIPYAWIRRRHSLRTKGYFVTLSLRKSQWTYEELAEGTLRKVELAHFESGPEPTLVIPSLSEWTGKTPPWAMHRREEMFRKLISEHPPTYITYPADWDFTPEEKATDEAAHSQDSSGLEQMKRDLKIGQNDSKWNMEINADGTSTFRRKS